MRLEDDARRGEIGEEMVRARDQTGARAVGGAHGAHDRVGASGARRVLRSALVLERDVPCVPIGTCGARDDRDRVVQTELFV